MYFSSINTSSIVMWIENSLNILDEMFRQRCIVDAVGTLAQTAHIFFKAFEIFGTFDRWFGSTYGVFKKKPISDGFVQGRNVIQSAVCFYETLKNSEIASQMLN